MDDSEKQWRVVFADERGDRTLSASLIELDEDIWVFWRGKEVFLRVPSGQVASVGELR